MLNQSAFIQEVQKYTGGVLLGQISNTAALLTLLLSLAGNVSAPFTPQTPAESGSCSEMVPPVRLQRGDGLYLY